MSEFFLITYPPREEQKSTASTARWGMYRKGYYIGTVPLGRGWVLSTEFRKSKYKNWLKYYYPSLNFQRGEKSNFVILFSLHTRVNIYVRYV